MEFGLGVRLEWNMGLVILVGLVLGVEVVFKIRIGLRVGFGWGWGWGLVSFRDVEDVRVTIKN